MVIVLLASLGVVGYALWNQRFAGSGSVRHWADEMTFRGLPLRWYRSGEALAFWWLPVVVVAIIILGLIAYALVGAVTVHFIRKFW